MMIHRSASSRRRRASRSAASSPHRSQTLRRPSVAVGATTPTGPAPSMEAPQPRARRASIASVTPSEELAVAGVRGVTVTAAEDDASDYGHDSDDNLNESNLMPDNFNRSPRSSLVPEGNSRSRNSLVPDAAQFSRSRNNLAVDNFNRSPRNSLVPDTSAGRSPRNSLVPDYSRSPRGSLLPDVDQFNRSARNSLVPDRDPDYGRNSRNNLVPDSAYSRSARNSLVPDVSPSRSQRNSLVPDTTRSPRGSLVPEPNATRSPRGSIVGDLNSRSPRGSIGPDLGITRSPRGSIASEASFNRSPRNSLPLHSPRGSITSSTGGGLFDATRSPRGSIDMNAPGTSRAAGSNRSPSPYRMTARGAQGALNSTDAGGSRRASSSVSQVSADDRKHLCEHTKLTADTGLGLSAYGSVVYQLNHANMESSGLCDFVCRALGIVYRTVIVTVVLVCLTALPIVMFIMGIQFVRDCPKEPNIPVYMIVGGSFGTIKMLWMLWRQVKSRRYERLDARNRSSRPPEDGLSTSAGSRITNFLLTSFLIVWFVLGNLWILGIYWPAFEPTLRDPNRWCHKTLYVFSLVHLVIMYSLVGVVVLTVIVMVACQLCICPLLISCK